MGCWVLSLLYLPFFSAGIIKFVDGSAGNKYEWGYGGKNSPSNWHEEYPHCGGNKQSPIDIVSAQIVYNDDLGDIQLIGFNETHPVNFQLINNGHSAQVNVKGPLFIEGGGLPTRYKVEQFHFHWGDRDQRGSEHYLDGQAYPMEMHIVHYSMDYANISDALNKPDGLAVLAAFFEVGSEPHPTFHHVVSHFNKTSHKNDAVPLRAFSLRGLLPDDITTFYRYSGSLTTPPCYESVVWTIYKAHIKISKQQLNMFRWMLKANSDGELNEVQLVNDFRPIQSLNARLVQTNRVQGLTGSTDRHRLGRAVALFVALFHGFTILVQM